MWSSFAQLVQKRIFKCECFRTYYRRGMDGRQDDNSSHGHWTVELENNNFFINFVFTDRYLIVRYNQMSDML